MRNVHTVPVEVCAPKFDGTFETEPYEAGWAVEALALVYVRETSGSSAQLALRPQISADGVRWIDFPIAFPPMMKAGGYSLALSHFGNWLRLAGTVTGGSSQGGPTVVVDLYWVLK